MDNNGGRLTDEQVKRFLVWRDDAIVGTLDSITKELRDYLLEGFSGYRPEEVDGVHRALHIIDKKRSALISQIASNGGYD